MLRSVVNSLGYLSSTRPDILSALGAVARGQASGRKRHLTGAQTLASYANTVRRGFRYPVIVQSSTKTTCIGINAFFDANLSSDSNSRMGGIIILVVGTAEYTVSFRTGLSTTTCTSTCESELGAANFVAKMMLSVKNVLYESFRYCKRYHIQNSLMRGDNSAANLIAGTAAGTRAVRHLSLQSFFVRSLSERGLVNFGLVPSNENPSDILTKVVHEELLQKLLTAIGCIKLTK